MAVLVFAVTIFVVACAKTPKLTDGGKQVEYFENTGMIKDRLNDPAQCRFIAYVEVEANVGVGLTESRAKSEHKRRLVRARNIAADNKANVIVADGEVTGKSQKFRAYQCK
jgi:hypothetical protein